MLDRAGQQAYTDTLWDDCWPRNKFVSFYTVRPLELNIRLSAILFLTLWVGFREHEILKNPSRIIAVIYEDGLLYYGCVACECIYYMSTFLTSRAQCQFFLYAISLFSQLLRYVSPRAFCRCLPDLLLITCWRLFYQPPIFGPPSVSVLSYIRPDICN